MARYGLTTPHLEPVHGRVASTPSSRKPSSMKRSACARRRSAGAAKCWPTPASNMPRSATTPISAKNCEVADAVIGKFTAIANSVRIGAPNHPMGRRVTAPLHLLPGILRRDDLARPRFLRRAPWRPGDRRQRCLDRPCRHPVAGGHGRRRRGDRRRRRRQPRCAALHDRRRRPGAGDPPALSGACRQSLRRIAWWDWPDEIIFKRLSDFRSEAIEAVLRALRPGG